MHVFTTTFMVNRVQCGRR